jgi:hypothetical protein
MARNLQNRAAAALPTARDGQEKVATGGAAAADIFPEPAPAAEKNLAFWLLFVLKTKYKLMFTTKK